MASIRPKAAHLTWERPMDSGWHRGLIYTAWGSFTRHWFKIHGRFSVPSPPKHATNAVRRSQKYCNTFLPPRKWEVALRQLLLLLGNVLSAPLFLLTEYSSFEMRCHEMLKITVFSFFSFIYWTNKEGTDAEYVNKHFRHHRPQHLYTSVTMAYWL